MRRAPRGRARAHRRRECEARPRRRAAARQGAALSTPPLQRTRPPPLPLAPVVCEDMRREKKRMSNEEERRKKTQQRTKPNGTHQVPIGHLCRVADPEVGIPDIEIDARDVRSRVARVRPTRSSSGPRRVQLLEASDEAAPGLKRGEASDKDSRRVSLALLVREDSEAREARLFLVCDGCAAATLLLPFLRDARPAFGR